MALQIYMPGQFLQLCFCQKTFLFLFSLGPFHSLQNPVIKELVLVGIVENAGQFLKIQADGAGLQVPRLEILDKVLEIGGCNLVNGGVSVCFEVVAHKTIRIPGFIFDIAAGGKVSGVSQQAYDRFFLRLTVAKAGGILVAGFLWNIVVKEGDAEFPVGRVLYGGDGKWEVGFYSNVHGCRGL